MTINRRINYLFWALKFSSEVHALLTTGERIMINQERSDLYQSLSAPIEVRTVPREIEDKLKELHRLMKVYKWVPNYPDPFFNI